MQTKTKIVYVTSPSDMEQSLKEDGLVKDHGYAKWDYNIFTIHIPFDASFEEKVLLVKNQIDREEKKIGKEIYFENHYMWLKHNREVNGFMENQPHAMRDSELDKISQILFDIKPDSLTIMEEKILKLRRSRFGEGVLGCYKSKQVRLYHPIYW